MDYDWLSCQNACSRLNFIWGYTINKGFLHQSQSIRVSFICNIGSTTNFTRLILSYKNKNSFQLQNGLLSKARKKQSSDLTAIQSHINVKLGWSVRFTDRIAEWQIITDKTYLYILILVSRAASRASYGASEIHRSSLRSRWVTWDFNQASFEPIPIVASMPNF